MAASEQEATDETAAKEKPLEALAVTRNMADEAAVKTGRLEAAAAKREDVDEVAAAAKRLAGAAAQNMVAETVSGTGRLGAAAAVKREDTDEVTSKAKRRGVNLAANEESVEAKRLVQKVAKEATAPATTRSTAETFAVVYKTTIITKRRRKKNVWKMSVVCTKRKWLMSTEDKACGHNRSMLGDKLSPVISRTGRFHVEGVF